jgi:hypothetical protein
MTLISQEGVMPLDQVALLVFTMLLIFWYVMKVNQMCGDTRWLFLICILYVIAGWGAEVIINFGPR